MAASDELGDFFGFDLATDPVILKVRETRDFSLNLSTGVGTREFLVWFRADDDTMYMDYPVKAALVKFATDPGYPGDPDSAKIPIKREELPSFPRFKVDEVEVDLEEEQNNLWRVTVSYVHEDDLDGTETDTDPWDEPWIFNWSHQNIQEVLNTDKAGKAITNSLGDDFDEKVIVDKALRLVTISRKTRIVDFDPIVAVDFINKINSVLFTIQTYDIPIEQAKLLTWDGVTASQDVTKAGVTVTEDYWQETLQFLINPETWQGYVLDIGNLGKETAALPPAEKVNVKGDILVGPHRLNGDGQYLTDKTGALKPIIVNPAFPHHPLTTAAAVFIKYDFYDKVDFNALDTDGQP